MGKLLSSRPWRITSAVTGTLLAAIVGTSVWTTHYPSIVHSALGTTPSKIISVEDGEEIDTNYFPTNGKTLEEWRKEELNMIEKVQAEGTVLLKNNGVLPLKNAAKVSAFGYYTVQSVSTALVQFGGADYTYLSFKECMEEDGKLQLNPTLYNYFSEKSTAKLALRTNNEVAIDDISSVRSSYSSYNDAAIVVLGRAGGEGSDLDYDVSTEAAAKRTGGKPYLQLQDRERAILKEASDNFDKVIVIINGSYALELGFLEEYDIDACLFVGAVGSSGYNAVSDILTGKINPSGRTVDTFATDSLSAPAMVNFGDYTYANSSDISAAGGANASKYIVEKEGIYIGYKYYETRYEDSVLYPNRNASSSAGAFVGDTWNYDKEVIYPFGYGLSYNKFTQKLNSVKESRDGLTYEVKVTVTCTDDLNGLAGRDVVEVYAQTPFNGTKGVEASAIQLVGFGKTKALKKGESDTLTITVQKEDLAHYDAFGAGTYILENGDYYLAIGDNAHDALNNVIEMKDASKVDGDASKAWTFNQKTTDTKTFSIERTTGKQIKNLFDNIDLNYWMKDEVTYLSRSNWEETWPTEQTSLTANDAMIKALKPTAEYEAATHASGNVGDVTPNKETTINAVAMKGVAYDDPIWDDFLDQLAIDDYVNLMASSGIPGVDKISKPTIYKKDGSHKVDGNTYLDDNGERTKIYSYVYPSAVIQASSFDTELMYEVGIAYGEADTRTGTTGRYCPSVNIHRTPYSGRNFEYYSEDGFLSGAISVPVIKGLQEKGVIPFLKHFAFNEQETNRSGLSTFTTQQAAREIYLEAFKAGIVEGKVNGIMSAFNRVGCTWTGGSRALINDLVRIEWGSLAICDTDMGSPGLDTAYMSFKAGCWAGTTMWASSALAKDEVKAIANADYELAVAAREAAHILLYQEVNSNGYNGIKPTDKVVTVRTWWQDLLLASEIVLGVVTAAGVGLAVFSELKKKEN